MIFRVVVALGGLTFVASGLAVLLSDSCHSVVWGPDGSERAGRFSATCVEAVGVGMPQVTAGAIAIGIGALLLVFSLVPVLMRRYASADETVDA
jgi:hypothetical protein